MNSNAGMDQLLRYPKGLSIRAAGGQKILQFKDYLDEEEDCPEDLFEVSHLDIWDQHGQPHLLEPVRIEAADEGWVQDIIRSESTRFPALGEKLKFRLLLTRPRADEPYPWPKYDARGPPEHRQLIHLPLYRRDLKDLFEAWHLPHDWLFLRLDAVGNGNFYRKTEYDPQTGVPNRIGFVFHTPSTFSILDRFFTTPNIALYEDTRGKDDQEQVDEEFRNCDPFVHSVAYSHDLIEGTAVGIFDGITDRSYIDISERLKAESCMWSSHPLYLLIVLLDIHVGFCTSESHWASNDIGLFERPDRKDANELVKHIEYIGDFLASLTWIERTIKFHLNFTTFLLGTLAYLDRTVINQSSRFASTTMLQMGMDGEKRLEYMAIVGAQMEESLQNTAFLLENHLYQCHCIQMRATSSLGLIQALLSRIDHRTNLRIADQTSRDSKTNIEIAEASKALAHDAKQDSTSVMTISILTMAFLPATAVAAICSMGALDWQTPAQDRIYVSPHFWIYWAVVLPLTAAVMGAWFIWYFLYRKPKMDRERMESECTVCREQAQVHLDEGTEEDDRRKVRLCEKHRSESPSRGGHSL